MSLRTRGTSGLSPVFCPRFSPGFPMTTGENMQAYPGFAAQGTELIAQGSDWGALGSAFGGVGLLSLEAGTYATVADEEISEQAAQNNSKVAQPRRN